MSSRRKFIGDLALLGIGSQLKLESFPLKIHWSSSDWGQIKKQFPSAENGMLNLNSGSAGTMPLAILRDYIKLTEYFNNNALYRAHDAYKSQLENTYSSLGEFMDCNGNELAFTKNTTESLNAVIWGFPFRPKGECIIAESDYPYAVNAFHQRARRDAINVKMLELRPWKMSNEEIIEAYTKAINENTQLILVTMITHREGQILPVKEIIQMAHSRNVPVLVDGAHALGHLPLSMSELDCDYFASCMHKWLNGPHGNGVLFVKDKHIPELNPPAFPYPDDLQGKMQKFTYSGTVAFQKLACLMPVMEFNSSIDIHEKSERLSALTDYWCTAFNDIKGLQLVRNKNQSPAIAGFSIGNKAPEEFRRKLYENYHINIKRTGYPGKPFFRVSTNLFVDENDLDRFIYSVKELLNS